MRIDTNTIQSAELAQWLEIFMAPSRQKIAEAQGQKDALDVRGAIYNDLRTKLLALKRLASEMSGTGGLSALGAKSAVTSLDGVLTATASAEAVAHSHSIHVQQLASAHSVISGAYTSSDTSLADADSGTKSFTIRVGDVDHVVSVVINAGAKNSDVLAAVAAAISDAAGGDVHAAAIQDTDATSRLSITADATGSAHKMTFDDTDGLLASLGVTNAAAATATTGGYVHADLGNHELDAKLTVDGIAIVRGSNSIADVVPGVTLTLQAAQAATDPDVSLTVAADTKASRAKIDAFLAAYNEAYTYLNDKVKVDRETFARGDLAGNSSYTTLWQRLRVGMAGPVSTSGDPALFALAQIGITSGNDGTFSVTDATKLDAALKDDTAKVAALFNTDDGIGKRLDTLLDTYTKAGGVIASSSDSLRSQKKLFDGRITRLEALQGMERDRLIEQYGALQQASQAQQSMLSMLDMLTNTLGL